MEATIRFKNGTEMTAEKNGDSFITAETPAFPEDLSIVTVISEEGTETYLNVLVTDCASIDGRYWFTFVEKSIEQDQAEKIAELQEENQFLIGCIMEISEEVWK